MPTSTGFCVHVYSSTLGLEVGGSEVRGLQIRCKFEASLGYETAGLLKTTQRARQFTRNSYRTERQRGRKHKHRGSGSASEPLTAYEHCVCVFPSVCKHQGQPPAIKTTSFFPQLFCACVLKSPNYSLTRGQIGTDSLFPRTTILAITEGARKEGCYIMFEIRSLWVLHGNMMFPYKVSHRF